MSGASPHPKYTRSSTTGEFSILTEALGPLWAPFSHQTTARSLASNRTRSGERRPRTYSLLDRWNPSFITTAVPGVPRKIQHGSLWMVSGVARPPAVYLRWVVVVPFYTYNGIPGPFRRSRIARTGQRPAYRTKGARNVERVAVPNKPNTQPRCHKNCDYAHQASRPLQGTTK